MHCLIVRLREKAEIEAVMLKMLLRSYSLHFCADSNSTIYGLLTGEGWQPERKARVMSPNDPTEDPPRTSPAEPSKSAPADVPVNEPQDVPVRSPVDIPPPDPGKIAESQTEKSSTEPNTRPVA